MFQRIKNVGHLILTVGAHAYYGYPGQKLTLIGVTGTDGKTTTVHLIDAILRAAEKRSAYISSIHARIGRKTIDTGLHTTTPYHLDLPKLLSSMVEEKTEVGILEVTSHAIDQCRIHGLHFALGVFTNISHEHLDYHGTFEAYCAVKAKLIKQCETVALNKDDGSFRALSTEARKHGVDVKSYGFTNDADVWASSIKATGSKTELSVHLPNGIIAISTRLLGRYNIANMLAAATAAYALGLSHRAIQTGLNYFPGIPGRLESIPSNTHIEVIVDFAHTPNAFQQLLPEMRRLTVGKLIHVFGAAGERDTAKRPIMGKRAQQLGNELIITAEDPRSESVEKISAEIAKGVMAGGGIADKTFWMIADRRQAIRFAIQKRASPGDLVLITGKGHERSMNISGTEVLWSDIDEARAALKGRG
ncbi:MAG: UDP-N-acetylmuramoyl-L-alanyl-D-glutamate--2,6-diaminopimelate ligase [bacterium]|nr:UDP-N-acetylmuramoyl-L-alanyl-D-glutamate--2,6-diaminopimelate ligase [bacterium]